MSDKSESKQNERSIDKDALNELADQFGDVKLDKDANKEDEKTIRKYDNKVEKSSDKTDVKDKKEDSKKEETKEVSGKENKDDENEEEEEEEEGDEGAVEEPEFDLLHQLENTVEVKLADQQADVNSPLYSAKNFEDLGLSKELLQGIYAMHYTKPSKIQERALPLLLAENAKNMIGQSQSGTGKTAAFVLTMLSKIDYNVDEVQAICLAPSRELARQIMDVAKEMGQYTKATYAYAIPDDEVRKLTKKTIKSHIIIGTPGTTKTYIEKKMISTKKVKILVLDEADNMFDGQGLSEHCLRVKKRLNKDCQFVLFSATFPEEVKHFAVDFAPEANEISLKTVELSIDAIKQFYVDCANNNDRDNKLDQLYDLMTVGQSIIFANSKAKVDRISDTMTRKGNKVIGLHAGLTNEQRDAMIDQFRSGEAKVLVGTNVIARGIDIPQVNLVINYDMPVHLGTQNPDYATYLHRIGRTGRFGKSGVAINFVSNESSFRNLEHITKKLNLHMVRLDVKDLVNTEKVLSKAMK